VMVFVAAGVVVVSSKHSLFPRCLGRFFFRRELYFVADVIKASIASCKVLRFFT